MCVQQFELGFCMCVCGVGLFLDPGTSERGAHVFLMYFLRAYAWLAHKVSFKKAYATLRACRF